MPKRQSYQELIDDNLARGDGSSRGCTPMFHRMGKHNWYGDNRYGFCDYFRSLADKAMSLWNIKKGKSYKLRVGPDTPDGDDVILCGPLDSVMANLFAIKMNKQGRGDFFLHERTIAAITSRHVSFDDHGYRVNQNLRCVCPSAGAIYIYGTLFVFADEQSYHLGWKLAMSTRGYCDGA